MRLVVDTNVFISGIFFSGPPYEILNAWRHRKVELVISPDILDEYRRVAEKLAKQYPGIDLEGKDTIEVFVLSRFMRYPG